LRQRNDGRPKSCHRGCVCNFSKIRVLVVDDSSVWRTFVMEHLRAAGFTIIDVAYDGAHAVFKAQREQPDLILMDVTLPYMSGIAATLAIRRAIPETKIVFVSGIDDAEVKRAALKAGAHDYVVKSLAGGRLIDVIKVVLAAQ
jgi:DNA-binding response OmpR family regulator